MRASGPGLLRNLSIRWRILLLIIALSLGLSVALTLFSVHTILQTSNAFVKQELDEGSAAILGMVSDEFLCRATGPDSIPLKEYEECQRRFDAYAKDSGYQYVYLLEPGKDGKSITYIICSVLEGEIENGTATTHFFTETPPQEVLDAVNRVMTYRGTTYATYTSKYGSFRTGYRYAQTSSGRSLVACVDFSLERIESLSRRLVWGGFAEAAIFCVLFGLLAMWVAERIAMPLRELAGYASSLSSTSFRFDEDARQRLDLLGAASRDEVGKLASAFLDMDDALGQYIADLKETTAAKERMESELQIGHDIQMSFLRMCFPAFPDRPEFDLYAGLVPARQVGGDLYEFAMIDEDHLLLCVGDVSEKGVPAALFMSATQSMLRAFTHEGILAPEIILSRLNQALSDGNDALMFVTMFCSILNVKTGELRFSNGGHNPPLIIRKNSAVDWLKLPHGMVLGALKESVYLPDACRLEKGDKILIYTDGVTEAMNAPHDLYSEERLIDAVREHADMESEALVRMLFDSVEAFVDGAEASDDITLLALELKQ